MSDIFKFEVQSLITITIEAENSDEARLRAISNLHAGIYDDELHDADVSELE